MFMILYQFTFTAYLSEEWSMNPPKKGIMCYCLLSVGASICLSVNNFERKLFATSVTQLHLFVQLLMQELKNMHAWFP